MSRPKLGRTEVLRLVFTPDELGELLMASARAGAKELRNWAREALISAAADKRKD